jgi:precorrin-2 dehydrogenase / sirohydrochlorin ferrochelatase
MLVDLALNEKIALIIGKGDEVEIRARQLLAENAKITVLTDRATEADLRSSTSGKSLTIIHDGLTLWKQFLQKSERAFLVVVSTGDPDFDEEISRAAHCISRLVYVVDRPHLNDLNMLGVAKLGDIRVGVSTRGLSPAMAGLLRRKIEALIEPEDILQVKLQGEVKAELRRTITDPIRRKKVVYKLIRDKKISLMLQSKKFEDAHQRALDLIMEFR